MPHEPISGFLITESRGESILNKAIDLTAQAVITLDQNGTFRAETTGPNGSRIKIDLDADWRSRNPELVAALELRSAELRHQAERLIAETRKTNISYVDEKHRSLATQVWGADFVNRHFNRRVCAHYAGDAGNLSNAKKPLADLENLI